MPALAADDRPLLGTTPFKSIAGLHGIGFPFGCEQAFAYARNMAGDVTELFDVLAGKLRPGHKNSGGGEGQAGTSLSRTSILNAQYRGSSDNTVLGMANLKRIQNFLDEPQKHLGQVMNNTG